MSAEPEAPEQDDSEQFFTVFEGSSPDDVSHAGRLWSSLSLLPPVESRLVSADIGQRLPVSGPPRVGTVAAAARRSAPEPPSVPAPGQREKERRRYAAMADQRREILALLRRQREQRIQKELLSRAVKPKAKPGGEKAPKPTSDSEMDEELVKQLQ